MRVVVWPAGDENDATSQYRLLLPARALAAQGADVHVDRRGPTVIWSREWRSVNPPPDVKVMGCMRPHADVVVLQRPGRRWWADVIPFLRAHGVRVVVDVDDRFDAIDRRNIAHRQYDTANDPTHHYAWIDEAARRADVVTATTPSLVERYGYGHGVLLPNLVPERYLKVEPAERRQVVGWSGSVRTHPGDLDVTGGAVQRVLAGRKWGFHVVGTGVGVRDALGLADNPTNTGVSWVPFHRYPDALSEIAVGIVPLRRSLFNDAKSALKLLEFSAVGVPAVVSPTPDNRRVVRLGLGLVAKRPADWERRLRLLTSSSDAWADVQGRSREAAAALTYEAHCDRWMVAWSMSLSGRRSQ